MVFWRMERLGQKAPKKSTITCQRPGTVWGKHRQTFICSLKKPIDGDERVGKIGGASLTSAAGQCDRCCRVKGWSAPPVDGRRTGMRRGKPIRWLQQTRWLLVERSGDPGWAIRWRSAPDGPGHWPANYQAEGRERETVSWKTQEGERGGKGRETGRKKRKEGVERRIEEVGGSRRGKEREKRKKRWEKNKTKKEERGERLSAGKDGKEGEGKKKKRERRRKKKGK